MPMKGPVKTITISKKTFDELNVVRGPNRDSTWDTTMSRLLKSAKLGGSS